MASLDATQGAPARAQNRSAAHDRLSIFAVLSAMALVVLDAGIANVALPSIDAALRLAPGRAVLVVTAYQAGLIAALLPCGALGERYGYRRVFTAGVAAFALASLLCAVSPTLALLAMARFVQGLGGGAVMALGVALLRLCVPPDRLGAAIGWNALTVALTSAAAPSVGAIILSNAGWPWLFAAGLPLSLMALAASRALPGSLRAERTLDPASMVLNAAAFGLLIGAVEVAPIAPLAGGLMLAGSAVGLAILIRREAPKPEPLVPIDLLRLKPMRTAAVASVCCFTAQTAGLLALPFLLQQSLGMSPALAGLCTTPWPVAVAVAAVFAGRLADRWPTAWICAIGAAVLAAGLAGAAWRPGDPQWLVAFIVLCGIGFGLFQSPNNRSLFLAAPRERSGAAGGLQGMARVLGQTAGGLLVTALFSACAPDLAPRSALAIAAGFALAAGVASALRREEASAMAPAKRA